MKILNAQQMRDADNATIAKQDITSLNLMERAASAVFLWLQKSFTDKEIVFHVICGQGNNGGDGLQVAKMLHDHGYKAIIYIITSAGSPTLDFLQSMQVVDDIGIPIYEDPQNLLPGSGQAVIIDAMFGIGLTRELNEECRKVIQAVNDSDAFVLSIDMPSGMFIDRTTDFAVQANVVLTFQSPKLAFYLPSHYRFINRIVVLDIGLDREFINTIHTNIYLTDFREATARYNPVEQYAHKGTQGHALIIGGSYGKTGAVCLSAKAALKAGCGLVTAYLPECGYTVLQSAFPEAMVITNGEKHIQEISFALNAKAIGIGMGMGHEPETQQALHDFLRLNTTPLVLDADALNILSYNKEWLELLPENTIMTPHPKELERLMGPWEGDFDKLEKMKAFSKQHKIILVAKDARTMVIYHDTVFINSTGNAALATGGSGDVLTGIITGLLAQGYDPADAAVFGVYLHGLTADIAVATTSVQAFTASTIIDYMGKAFLQVEKESR